MKFSQVPALGVRACMSSSTPWSLSVLTFSVRSVLPSILSKISTLQISDFSMLNRSAHTRRYRRFASILRDTDARLAVEVVVSLLPPVGLSPTTLHQLAWRTDSFRLYLKSFKCWRRNSQMVRCCGKLFAARNRNATSSSSFFAIPRDENVPVA